MSGPSSATSQGDPTQLHRSGVTFQGFTNAVRGIAETGGLQAEGGLSEAVATPADDTLRTSADQFAHAVGRASDLFLQFLISAQLQLADAATDLFDCAGDFAQADAQLPPGATPGPPNRDGFRVYYEDDGTGGRTEWWVDKEGHVAEVFHDDGISLTAPSPPGGSPSTPPVSPGPVTPGAAPTQPTPSSPLSSSPSPTATPSSSPTPTASPSGQS